MLHTFQSTVSWPIKSRVIAGFFQSLGLFGWLVFHFFLVSITFAYTSRNPMWMWFSSSLLGSWVGSPRFICLGINFSDLLDQQITGPFFQTIAPIKCQAYRMEVLSFTLSFSYRWYYFTISNLVRFWYKVWSRELGIRISIIVIIVSISAHQ